MGQTAYALLAWCVWWGYISVAIAVVSWATLTLFIYYNSQQYSTVGLLLAVFGVSSLLQGCSDEVYDPSTSYYGIINTTGGICIMCVVDTLFAPGRASEMAVRKYFGPWDMLVKQSEQLFDPEIKTLPARKGALRGMIADAGAMGSEAFEEPRYWRVAWPTDTFSRAVTALSTLRFTLASLEGGVTNVKADGRAEKEEHFIAALKLTEFGSIRKLLKQRFDNTKIALEKALNNETGETLMDFSKSQQLSSDLGKIKEEDAKAIENFVKAFNGGEMREIADDGTLEDDPIADMSILVSSLQAIFDELEAVNREMNK